MDVEHDARIIRLRSLAVSRLLDRVLPDIVPDAKVELSVETSEAYGTSVIALIPLRQMDFRLAFGVHRLPLLKRWDLNAIVRQRLAEVLRQEERFANRIDSVRDRVQGSVDRIGSGLRLVKVEMAAHPFELEVHWNDYEVEAVVEFLGHHLRPETARYHGFSGREIAGFVRSMRSDQRRRAARLDLLARKDAVAEVDAITESLIAANGLTTAALLARVLASEAAHVTVGEDGGNRTNGMSFGLLEGRLYASGYVADSPRAHITGTALRVDDGLTDETLAAMAGRPAGGFFAHPALRSARIASAQRHTERATDIKLRARRRYLRRDEASCPASRSIAGTPLAPTPEAVA